MNDPDAEAAAEEPAVAATPGDEAGGPFRSANEIQVVTPVIEDHEEPAIGTQQALGPVELLGPIGTIQGSPEGNDDVGAGGRRPIERRCRIRDDGQARTRLREPPRPLGKFAKEDHVTIGKLALGFQRARNLVVRINDPEELLGTPGIRRLEGEVCHRARV